MRGGRSEEAAADEGVLMSRRKWEKVGRGTETGREVVLNLLEGGVFTSDSGDGPIPPFPPCPGYWGWCGIALLD